MDNSLMGQYDNEGGFISSPQFNSPGGPVQERKKEKCLAPVVIKQILESTDTDFKIGPIDVDLVTVVGIIRSIVVSSTKIDYTIEDDTGIIGGSYYIDQQEEDVALLVEDTYCRVYASARTSQGKRHLIVFSIEPLHDLNELVMHILEVVHCELKVKEMDEDMVAKSTSNVNPTMDVNLTMNVNSTMSTSVMETSCMTDSTDGLSKEQQRVINAIGACKDSDGIHVDDLGKMPLGMSAAKLSEILETMSGEGYIFQGCDEYHYKKL